MRDDLPQGAHRCLDELQANLGAVANRQSSATLRRVGELHAQFHFGRFEELCAEGVTSFLDRFQGACATSASASPTTFACPRAPTSHMKFTSKKGQQR